VQQLCDNLELMMQAYTSSSAAKSVVRRFPTVLTHADFVLTYEVGDELSLTAKERKESRENKEETKGREPHMTRSIKATRAALRDFEQAY
jgi:hypothetical protein